MPCKYFYIAIPGSGEPATPAPETTPEGEAPKEGDAEDGEPPAEGTPPAEAAVSPAEGEAAAEGEEGAPAEGTEGAEPAPAAEGEEQAAEGEGGEDHTLWDSQTVCSAALLIRPVKGLFLNAIWAAVSDLGVLGMLVLLIILHFK